MQKARVSEGLPRALRFDLCIIHYSTVPRSQSAPRMPTISRSLRAAVRLSRVHRHRAVDAVLHPAAGGARHRHLSVPSVDDLRHLGVDLGVRQPDVGPAQRRQRPPHGHADRLARLRPVYGLAGNGHQDRHTRAASADHRLPADDRLALGLRAHRLGHRSGVAGIHRRPDQPHGAHRRRRPGQRGHGSG